MKYGIAYRYGGETLWHLTSRTYDTYADAVESRDRMTGSYEYLIVQLQPVEVVTRDWPA